MRRAERSWVLWNSEERDENRIVRALPAVQPLKETKVDWKIFATVFAAVFVAELGDKTQLATLLFAADRAVSKLTVFVAASAALVLCSAIGVLAGGLISNYVSEKALHYVAGSGFILIGVWTLYRA